MTTRGLHSVSVCCWCGAMSSVTSRRWDVNMCACDSEWVVYECVCAWLSPGPCGTWSPLPAGRLCLSLGCGCLLVPGCVTGCSGVAVGPLPLWVRVAWSISLVGWGGGGGLLRAGWLCSQLVTGWPASSRSTAYCLWESHPLAMGTPSGASILLLLGWMRGCRSDVWPWVLSTLQGLGWESCPGSISICLLLLWGCYCSFPPSLSSQFMTNTHKHLSGD